MRESPHVEICFNNFRSKYVVSLITAQTYCLMWSFKSKCLWPNTSSCRKRQSLAYTGLPQVRKWSGVKFFKARKKSGNFNLSPRFWRKARENRHYGTTDKYFFEILSVSVYGLAGGGHYLLFWINLVREILFLSGKSHKKVREF